MGVLDDQGRKSVEDGASASHGENGAGRLVGARDMGSGSHAPLQGLATGDRGKDARPSRIYSTISEGPGMRHFTPTIHEIVIDTETTTMSQAMSE